MAQHFWYALKVRGGKEEKTKQAIENGFAKTTFQSSLKAIHIPFQRVYDIRKGKREIKKQYFAYILVHIDLSQDNVKQCLIQTEGVVGFVTPTGSGKSKHPIPLVQAQIDNMLGKAATNENIQKNLDEAIKEGDSIEIIDGAFQGNQAIVQKTDKQSKRIEVTVRIFQKDTKLELNYSQVRKK